MTNAEPSDSGSLFCIFNCMKIFLLFLTICFAFANAQGVQPIENLGNIPKDKIQRSFDVSSNSLRKELWLEVEKNEIVKVCIDKKVKEWETKLDSKKLNDSCLVFQAPSLVGSDALKVHFSKRPFSRNIYLAIGMKHLKFIRKKVLLGYSPKPEEGNIAKALSLAHSKQEDPERFALITGTYLVDKYPVTNCEIAHFMNDSMPVDFSYKHEWIKGVHERWSDVFKERFFYKECPAHDTAANSIILLQAMAYANMRSFREGLKPYYRFFETKEKGSSIISKGQYIIGYFDFTKRNNQFNFIKVVADYSSYGYRLPYYDEWMILARGGDMKNEAPWGDSSVALNDTEKYAKLSTAKNFKSESVGQLHPNGYGLYDMFGLVWEHVLFEESNPFRVQKNSPSCLKGGDNGVLKRKDDDKYHTTTYWKELNYGYSQLNINSDKNAGFRLVRNIGNNVKWSEVKD